MVLSLLGLWVLLGAVWLSVYPFFVRDLGSVSPDELELQDLHAEKARLIAEIHELELDYQTGKLSEGDYEMLEQRLKSRAVSVMEEIDAREGVTADRSSG